MSESKVWKRWTGGGARGSARRSQPIVSTGAVGFARRAALTRENCSCQWDGAWAVIVPVVLSRLILAGRRRFLGVGIGVSMSVDSVLTAVIWRFRFVGVVIVAFCEVSPPCTLVVADEGEVVESCMNRWSRRDELRVVGDALFMLFIALVVSRDILDVRILISNVQLFFSRYLFLQHHWQWQITSDSTIPSSL